MATLRIQKRHYCPSLGSSSCELVSFYPSFDNSSAYCSNKFAACKQAAPHLSEIKHGRDVHGIVRIARVHMFREIISTTGLDSVKALTRVK